MRRVIWGLALAIALAGLLASCSTVRLSYQHADWLLMRMAGRYVDLDAAQARQFRAELARFHDWHRTWELPRYSEALELAADRVERGLSRRDAQWAIGEVRARIGVLGARAGEQFGPLLGTLSDQQLSRAQDELERSNAEFTKTYLTGDATRRAQRRAAWIRDQLSDWIGALTPQQRQQVDAFVAAYPDAVQLRLDERRRRQAVFLDLVREQRASARLGLQLADFLADPGAQRSAASRQAALRLEDGFVDLLIGLDRSLTPTQRQLAVARLRDYAADFRALNAQRVVAVN